MVIKKIKCFCKSLLNFINFGSWYTKFWNFLRYDLPNGVKNIIFFWKVVWNFRSWDYTYNLRIFAKSLEPLRNSLIKGQEVDITRLKKIKKIERAIEILNNIVEDKYQEIAESQLGFSVSFEFDFENFKTKELGEENRKIFYLCQEIESAEWKELWTIFEGQKNSHFLLLLNKISPEERNTTNSHDNWYDGTGMGHWWN